MSFHFSDASFENAVNVTCANRDIMYGFEPSQFSVLIPEEQDGGTIFQSRDSEHRFYALKASAEIALTQTRTANTPRNVFATLAMLFLQDHPYDLDVARWLAIANALIVGRAEYEHLNGFSPINMRSFVYDYMEFGADYALNKDQ